jgi:hypothetical protein
MTMTPKEVAMTALKNHDHEARNNNSDGIRQAQP